MLNTVFTYDGLAIDLLRNASGFSGSIERPAVYCSFGELAGLRVVTSPR
jgi:hypothetical protein